MSGIYIHIPFCKSRCSYCDFFSTTFLHKEDKYISAVIREISQRKDYLNNQPVTTIYFGGGTPSLLKIDSIRHILNCIHDSFSVSHDAEITLEANPGDLDQDKLQALKSIGINRLSIGIQSFDDDFLRIIGRRHSRQDALNAVQFAQSVGFDNISIDLIYALPSQTIEQWLLTLDTAINLGVQHISAYCLTIEENTPMHTLLRQGKITPASDELANQMYETCIKRLQKAGFIHYEVSNFCLPNFHSRHNSSYWNNTPYLGIGAGAHSYNGTSRQWNICNLDQYINGTPPTIEQLTSKDIYNERVMLSLRTKDGIDLTALSSNERHHCLSKAETYIKQDMLCLDNNHLALASIQASEVLNRIIIDLMM